MSSKSIQPLVGKVVVVTRAIDQAHQLAEELGHLGAVVYEFATIDIKLIETPLTHDVVTFDWIVFTSANGVRGFRASMYASGENFQFHNAKICAVGPSTQRELEACGVSVDLVPETYTAEAAFEAMKNTDVLNGTRVLLPQGNIATQDLAESLIEAGANVERVVVYETVCPHHDTDSVRGLIDARPDLVTFTSASTARNFCLSINPGHLKNTEYACIGPRTSAAARECGLNVAIEPTQHDIAGLIDAIIKHYS